MADMSLQTTYTKLPTTALIGACMSGAQFTTLKNSHASASQPIGSPVFWRTSGATSDKDVLPAAASTDLLAGIVARDDEHGRAWTDENGTHGQLDSTGYLAGVSMNVVRVGLVFVTNTPAVKPGDRLFIATQSQGAYTAAGQMGNVTATNAIDATTKGEWRSTAAAGAGAWLELRASNK